MGMPGVSTWNFGEAFAHLYLDSVAMNHNSIGRGYETFGNGSAETMRRDQFHHPTRRWNGIARCLRRGELTWSARDNLNYQETGALAALDDSAGESQRDAAQLLQEGLGLLAEGPDTSRPTRF